MNTHPSFDPEEAEILKNLVVEGSTPGTPAGAPDDPDATPAQAKADAPAATPEADPSIVAAPAEVPPAPTPEPAKAPEPAPTAPHEGGNLKAALRASRTQEKRMREELKRLQDENEALKQGTAPASTDLTDEELEELRTDYPTQYKVAMKARELEKHLTQQRQIEEPGFEPPSYDPVVQEVIDTVPDLVAWQFDPAAQDQFERAIDYDKALTADPDWRGRPAAERFAEAARRTKAAFGETAATPTPSPAPAGTRNDPAKVIADAPTDQPKGLSDLRGGGPANAPALDFSRMTDEEIIASLPVS